MKKYISVSKLMPVVAMAAAFSACKFEQDDFFDEAASIRIERTNQDIKQKLVAGSANGNSWLIQYFVAGTDDMDFEGFNLYGRFFESGKVTLSSDHRYLRNGNAGKYTEYTSVYEMLKEEGSVLSFSTWNDIITVFVDPIDPSTAPDALIGDGEGMNGDDRLVMMSYNDNEMLFRGERHCAPVRFIRLDCSPEEYIAKTAATKSVIASDKVTDYKVSASEGSMYIAGLNKGHFTLCDRLDDPLQTETLSCVFTANGFDLKRDTKIVSDTCRVFTLNADNTALTSGNVTITPYWGRSLQKWCSSTGKTLATSQSVCPSLAQMLDKLNTEIQAAFSSQELTGFSFGRSNEGGNKTRTGIVFLCSTKKTTYQVGFTATVTIDPETNKATIQADANDASSNFSNYEKKGFGSSFSDIVSALNGSYTLTTDAPFCPTSVRWTKDGDANFYFDTAIN